MTDEESKIISPEPRYPGQASPLGMGLTFTPTPSPRHLLLPISETPQLIQPPGDLVETPSTYCHLWQSVMTNMGRLFAGFYSAGCGVTSGAIFYRDVLQSIVGAEWPSGLIGSCVFYVNFKNNWEGTPAMLRQLFATSLKKCDHPATYWAAFLPAVVLCVLTGIAMGALTEGEVAFTLSSFLNQSQLIDTLTMLTVIATCACEMCMPLSTILNYFEKNGVYGAFAKIGRLAWNSVVPLLGCFKSDCFESSNDPGILRLFYKRYEKRTIIFTLCLEGEEDVFKQVHDAVKQQINTGTDFQIKYYFIQTDAGDYQVTIDKNVLEDPRFFEINSGSAPCLREKRSVYIRSGLSTVVMPLAFVGVFTTGLACQQDLERLFNEPFAVTCVSAFISTNIPFFMGKAALSINEVVSEIKDKLKAAEHCAGKFSVWFDLLLRIGSAVGNGAIAYKGIADAGASNPYFAYFALICGVLNSYYYGATPDLGLVAGVKNTVNRCANWFKSCNFFGGRQQSDSGSCSLNEIVASPG